MIRKARGRLDGQVHGAAPAPYRALDLIEGALSGWSLEEGYRAEEEAVGELLPGRQAQASLYAFDLVDRRAKSAPGRPDAEPRPIRKVGIVGAGLMAAQLATLFLRRLEVPGRHARPQRGRARAARATTIEDELAEQVAKGRYDEGKARFLASLVSTSTELRATSPTATSCSRRSSRSSTSSSRSSPSCASTSSPTACSRRTPRASRSTEMGADVGIHFFNPVAVLPLVELVRTPSTDDETLATAWAFAEGLRKRPGARRATRPAFVVNRVLTRLMSVVLDALERGTDADEADEAILALGLPMAPSVLLQMVGPRVANHVLETLHDGLPRPLPALADARRTTPRARTRSSSASRRRSHASEMLESARSRRSPTRSTTCCEEGVVAEAKDVDTALLLGAGWPFWLGGITKYLDQVGISEKMFGRPLAEVGAGAPAT